MNWTELLTAKRFWIAVIGLIAVVVAILWDYELDQEMWVEVILVIIGIVTGGLAGYVGKEKRVV